MTTTKANQTVERMAAGRHISSCRTRWAAAIAHFSRYHHNPHAEKIYENAPMNRLRKQGLDVKQQHPIQVFDEDETLLGVLCFFVAKTFL